MLDVIYVLTNCYMIVTNEHSSLDFHEANKIKVFKISKFTLSIVQIIIINDHQIFLLELLTIRGSNKY